MTSKPYFDNLSEYRGFEQANVLNKLHIGFLEWWVPEVGLGTYQTQQTKQVPIPDLIDKMSCVPCLDIVSRSWQCVLLGRPTKIRKLLHGNICWLSHDILYCSQIAQLVKVTEHMIHM